MSYCVVVNGYRGFGVGESLGGFMPLKGSLEVESTGV